MRAYGKSSFYAFAPQGVPFRCPPPTIPIEALQCAAFFPTYEPLLRAVGLKKLLGDNDNMDVLRCVQLRQPRGTPLELPDRW